MRVFGDWILESLVMRAIVLNALYVGYLVIIRNGERCCQLHAHLPQSARSTYLFWGGRLHVKIRDSDESGRRSTCVVI